MKTSQRTFVVEFKSGRRQLKARTNSIWGDTDFKALARAAKDEAPSLFKANETSGTPDERGDMSPGMMNLGSAGEHRGNAELARAEMPSVGGAGVEVAKQHQGDTRAAEAVTQLQESQPVSQARRTSRDSARKTVKPAAVDANAKLSMGRDDARNVEAATTSNPISFDELAALDAENRRLERLLAEQLHAENLQLKKMLSRFDITLERIHHP
jgi:hypothetical protein